MSYIFLYFSKLLYYYTYSYNVVGNKGVIKNACVCKYISSKISTLPNVFFFGVITYYCVFDTIRLHLRAPRFCIILLWYTHAVLAVRVHIFVLTSAGQLIRRGKSSDGKSAYRRANGRTWLLSTKSGSRLDGRPTRN